MSCFGIRIGYTARKSMILGSEWSIGLKDKAGDGDVGIRKMYGGYESCL